MRLTICFYSYFKDLAECERITETLPDGSTVEDLLKAVAARFPKLAPLQKSTLVAVGVDYQHRGCVLKENDEVSLFPPVQGG
jgi:molybdopterin converting factor small subunit